MNDIVKTGGALAIRADQTQWTEQQVAVLRQSGISQQVTREEMSGFLHLCQRTGLDPFSRQIYLIGRYDRRAGREVFTPQTGIDGYRVVAHRVVAASGEAFGYEDTVWCDKSGQWRDVWLADAPPAAAKVTVIRNGMRFSAVALFREYVQTNRDGKPLGMWAKMPAGQLAKCAEALALRKAFPHDLAGVYTAEEMGQADNPAPVAAAPERHLRTVQPGEPDPWSTPAPQQAAEFEPHAEAQALAKRAAAVGDRFILSAVIDEAKRHLPADARILAPDTEQQDTLRDYLMRRWQVLPEQVTSKQQEEPVDAEIVPDDDHAAAVAELRAAADAANLEDFDNGAALALGCPIAQATPDAIRALASQISGHAA